MHTPQGPPGNMGQKYPSMQSVHSLLSQGYLPPGHGYIPKPIKPDKPYGPTFISVMNRTWRGPGRKYIKYAIVTWCFAILFLCASGLYLGHRNVSRMIVLRTEWFGAIFTIIFICLFCLTVHLLYRARQESNRWRGYVRFRAEGLYHVVPFNDEYDPKDSTELQTGTYGKRALREIPKPGRRGRRGRKKKDPQGQSQGQLYEKKGQPPLEQVPEEPGYGYDQYQVHPAAPQNPPSRGFIPMDQGLNPGRYGYRGAPHGMHIQHEGQGESQL